MKELCWYGVVVEKISDCTLVNLGKRRQCYKANEVEFVFWDAVPEARSIDPFYENKWNKNCYGSWIN